MKGETYAKTDEAAALAVGISLPALRQWKVAPDFPVKRGARGWPVSELLAYQITRKTRDKRNAMASGEHPDRKGRKLDVEIEILELKRDEIRRELVPVSEMLGQISEVAGILRWGAEQFPALMGVETKDPAAVAVAEKVRDRIVARLTEKLEEAGIAAA